MPQLSAAPPQQLRLLGEVRRHASHLVLELEAGSGFWECGP